jgi:hypothetical protein
MQAGDSRKTHFRADLDVDWLRDPRFAIVLGAGVTAFVAGRGANVAAIARRVVPPAGRWLPREFTDAVGSKVRDGDGFLGIGRAAARDCRAATAALIRQAADAPRTGGAGRHFRSHSATAA